MGLQFLEFLSSVQIYFFYSRLLHFHVFRAQLLEGFGKPFNGLAAISGLRC